MKTNRQKQIVELITKKSIETQEQLLQELLDCGYKCTQATVSRDIKELQVVKALDGIGGYRYYIPRKSEADKFDARFRIIFRECVTSLDYAQNLVVIKTMPGLAAAAGANLDALRIPAVLGTISGDDTTLVIMHDADSAAAFCAEIRKMLE
ncbi:MAG: arginine repressor [Oscillospiraceae bacterium]|jgi:transcriptional regulator of arginine metabolism|nr:arginine repressor [Oscillospiraceae bacterium]